MKPRVFIPQIPMKFDPNQGGMVPKFETLEQAKEFGELVILVNSPMTFASRQDCIDKIRVGLQDFSLDDFFLPMGSHFFMMVASIIISSKVNTIHVLEWNGREKQYRRTSTSVPGLFLNESGDRR